MKCLRIDSYNATKYPKGINIAIYYISLGEFG